MGCLDKCKYCGEASFQLFYFPPAGKQHHLGCPADVDPDFVGPPKELLEWRNGLRDGSIDCWRADGMWMTAEELLADPTLSASYVLGYIEAGEQYVRYIIAQHNRSVRNY